MSELFSDFDAQPDCKKNKFYIASNLSPTLATVCSNYYILQFNSHIAYEKTLDSVTMKGPTCMYYPYKDNYLIAGQIFSVLGFCLSWVWFATTSLGFLTMALYQGLWFCRQKKSSLIFYAVLALGPACMSVYTGIKILREWTESSWCVPFFLVSNNNDPEYISSCNERLYAYISFASAGLWVLASLFMIIFLASGNYDAWERKWRNEAKDQDGNASRDSDGSLPIARPSTAAQMVAAIVVSTKDVTRSAPDTSVVTADLALPVSSIRSDSYFPQASATSLLSADPSTPRVSLSSTEAYIPVVTANDGKSIRGARMDSYI